MIPLPDPPLRSGDLVLRPWRRADAPALVAAWADPEIQRWTGVPDARDLAAAEHWIAGADARRERWVSLDLVVERDAGVAGEVGLSSFDRDAGTVDIGWWIAPAHRGVGVASIAARLVVGWAGEDLGFASAIARCDADNPASVAVARRAGAMVLV